MKLIVQLSTGLFAALGMVVIIFGALLLSLSEGFSFASAMATPDAPVSPTVDASPVTPPPGITLVVSTPAPTHTQSLPGAAPCRPPAGWQPYTVIVGDQLDVLAAQAGISTQDLMEANCMILPNLLPDTLLYLPFSATLAPSATLQASFTPPTAQPTRTTTATPIARPACGPPRGWVLYTVQLNDNLFQLSQAFGVSISQLQQANCLSGTLIQAGTRIYVPNVATRTPSVTVTATPGPSNTVVLPTPTDSATPSPTVTEIPTFETPTETATEAPSATPTLAPTVMESSTETTEAPVEATAAAPTAATTEPATP